MVCRARTDGLILDAPYLQGMSSTAGANSFDIELARAERLREQHHTAWATLGLCDVLTNWLGAECECIIGQSEPQLSVRLQLEAIGADWIQGHTRAGHTVLIPSPALQVVQFGPEAPLPADPEGAQSAQPSFRIVLNDLVRRRSTLTVCVASRKYTGRIERIASDALLLASIEPPQSNLRLISIAAIELIDLGRDG